MSTSTTRFASMALAIAVWLGSAAPSAARDRTRPTTPGSFRVTARTAFSVSLAWNPSSDNSGNFTYWVSATNGGGTVVLPKTATSHTFNGLYPTNTYWFGIQAVDASGNYSPPISVSATTLADTAAPTTAPSVSVTGVGSTYASLAWTAAQDDGPFLSYQVQLNGQPYTETGANRSVTLRFLNPNTTYAIAVRAKDRGNNWSPLSALVSVTTPPINPNDVTPPTMPADLHEDHYAGSDTEIHVWWTQSSDDVDAQVNIRYDVYVNGVLQDILFGSGGRSIVYGDPGENIVEVTATDTAGNSSEPAAITVVF